MGQSRLSKMFVKVLICLALALALAHGAQKSYMGFKVFETEPLSEESANLLHKVMSRHDKDKFDFWRPPRKGRQARIMAAPSNVHELEATLMMFRSSSSFRKERVVARPRGTPSPTGRTITATIRSLATSTRSPPLMTFAALRSSGRAWRAEISRC